MALWDIWTRSRPAPPCRAPAENIGQNAYDRAVPHLTSAPFMIELDDDMIDAPDGWDETLPERFPQAPARLRLPRFFPISSTIRTMSRHKDHVRAQTPTCTTSRRLTASSSSSDPPPAAAAAMTVTRAVRTRWRLRRERQVRVLVVRLRLHGEAPRGRARSGLSQRPRARACRRVVLLHRSHPEKDAFWEYTERRQKRRDRVKRIALRVPFVRSLNAKHAWFVPPGEGA